MSPVVLVLFKTAFTALDQQPLCFLTLFQTLTICLKSPFQHILPLLPMHDTDSEKMDKNFLSFFPLHLQTFLYLSPSFPPLPSERKMSLFFKANPSNYILSRTRVFPSFIPEISASNSLAAPSLMTSLSHWHMEKTDLLPLLSLFEKTVNTHIFSYHCLFSNHAFASFIPSKLFTQLLNFQITKFSSLHSDGQLSFKKVPPPSFNYSAHQIILSKSP